MFCKSNNLGDFLMFKILRYVALVFFSFAFFSQLSVAQNNVVVVPLGGDSVNSAFVPIAVGEISPSAAFVGYGIVGATNPATGTYNVTLETNAGGAPFVVLSSYGSSPAEIVTYTGSGTSINVYIKDENGAARNSYFSIVVYSSTGAPSGSALPTLTADPTKSSPASKEAIDAAAGSSE